MRRKPEHAGLQAPEQASGGSVDHALTAFARSEDRTRALLAGYQDELVVTISSLAGRTSNG